MRPFLSLLLVVTFVSVTTFSQSKYSWQWKNTNCTYSMTFCWYGPYADQSDEVEAWGNHWTSQDKSEKPMNWITEVRCLKSLRTCILARNQELSMGTRITNVDLYRIREWSNFEIRADEEGSGSAVACEQDTLLVNRATASVSLLSNPGPNADSKMCKEALEPKTIVYKLEQ